MNTLSLIEDWYLQQCNGDWEHTYGVRIDTVDNPGWIVTIDLSETTLEKLEIAPIEVHKGASDWFFYKIQDKKFVASGDPSKLTLLLQKFVEISGLNL